jgi:hypothetical protein
MKSPLTTDTDTSGAIRVVRNLLAEMEDARAQRDSAARRFESIGEAILMLLERLPADEADALFSQLEEVRNPSSRPKRGGEVFGNIISLFQRTAKAEWSVPEVQTALTNDGTEADPKAVQNVVNYLARTGRLIRIGRGRYIVRDLGVEIDGEEHDFGTQRISEHD